VPSAIDSPIWGITTLVMNLLGTPEVYSSYQLPATSFRLWLSGIFGPLGAESWELEADLRMYRRPMRSVRRLAHRFGHRRVRMDGAKELLHRALETNGERRFRDQLRRS